MICIALLFVASCTTLTNAPSSGSTSLTPTGESWRDVLAQCTRRHEVYHWAMREADLRATLVTPKLRAAFLKERDSFHGKFAEKTYRELVGMGDPDEGVDALMKPGPASEQQILIFVAMYVADQKNRDLNASYTVWDTHLVRGEARVKPLQIETVRMSPAVADVYPYVDRFDDLYLMRFPTVDAKGRPLFGPGTEPLRLQVKSAWAKTAVEWTLRE